MQKKTIRLGDLTVSRLLAGGNPLSGFSHQGALRDQEMLDYYTVDNIKRFFYTCEENGIDAICARSDAFIIRVFREYWNQGGTARWIAQTAPEYADPNTSINMAVKNGASAVYIHGGVTDRLFQEKREAELHDIIGYGKRLGVPMGVAAHTPAYHLRLREMNLANEFHMISLYNLHGYQSNTREGTDAAFLDQDRSEALAAASQIPLPCILYKILGAGRKSMTEALTDIRPVLKPTDGLLVGMFLKDDADMARKNAELVYSL